MSDTDLIILIFTIWIFGLVTGAGVGIGISKYILKD